MTWDWPNLPLPRSKLERYRQECRRVVQPGPIGGHQARRRGQSLEFREFAHYTLGDDIRYVDWQASARFGRDDIQRWVVRRFSAEEQFTLAISLDTRDTMRGPYDPQLGSKRYAKLDLALWLAEALTWIMLRNNDRVILHGLFVGSRDALLELRGGGNAERIRPCLARLANSPTADQMSLEILRPKLEPATVWMIVTDCYFAEEQALRLAKQIRATREGNRWVILVDLNSWPYEKAILGTGPRRIQGPGLVHPRPEFQLGDLELRQVEENIERRKEPCRQAVDARTGYDVWEWEKEMVDGLEAFFERRFVGDRKIKDLLSVNII